MQNRSHIWRICCVLFLLPSLAAKFWKSRIIGPVMILWRKLKKTQEAPHSILILAKEKLFQVSVTSARCLNGTVEIWIPFQLSEYINFLIFWTVRHIVILLFGWHSCAHAFQHFTYISIWNFFRSLNVCLIYRFCEMSCLPQCCAFSGH